MSSVCVHFIARLAQDPPAPMALGQGSCSGSHGPGGGGVWGAASPCDACSFADPWTEGFKSLAQAPASAGRSSGWNSPSELSTCYTPILQVRKPRQMLGKVGLGWASSGVLQQDEKGHSLSCQLLPRGEGS